MVLVLVLESKDLLRCCRQFFLQLASEFCCGTSCKLHEPTPSVTSPEICMSRNFSVAATAEVGFSSCNGDCNKNIARQVHLRELNTKQRFVELVFQRRNEIARQVAREIV